MKSAVEIESELRDIPLGNEGRKGRLLVRRTSAGAWQIVHYRGVRKQAQKRVAETPLAELKSLHERSSEVERRVGVSHDLQDAVSRALDLPAMDDDVVTIALYIETVS